MRTKAEKNHKKAVEEKLKLNLPSPKVVLNASECARLLDGKGKTSVLLVEKGGKMVPAASVVPPSSISSCEVSSLPLASEANSKQTNNLNTSAPSTDSLKLNKEAEKISGCEASTENLTSSLQKEELSNDISKAILKPPKKRRGLEKKFESSSPALEVVNNGDISHLSSPLREPVDASSLHRTMDTNPKSELPLKAEFSQKHSVENLLLHQPSSSTSSANMMLQSNFPHLSYDTRTHPPQTELATSLATTITPSLTSSTQPVSISQPTSTEGYQSIASYHLALAQPPSQLYSHTSFTASSGSQNHMSLPYSVNNSQTTQSVAFNASLNVQTPQSVTFLNKQASPNEHSPSISLLATTAANSLSVSPSFQHLPEQEEPMNLSKSCKPAVGAITLQSHSTVSLNESRTAEDVSVSIVSQHSPAQGLTESTALNPPEPADAKKKQKKKISKAQKTTISESQETLQTTKISVHNGINTDSNTQLIKNMDSAILISSFHSDIVVDTCKVVSLDPNPKVLGMLVEDDNTSNTLYHRNDTPGLSHISDGNAVKAQSPKSSMTESTHTQDTLKESTASLVSSCGNKLLLSREPLSETLDRPLSTETDSAKKSKRLPKKKAEVPMDEESCASRKALYSVTIDDVIANYVYIPEPMDEFVLTEEEEATIRDQFEDHSAVSLKDTDASINKAVEVINKANDATSDKGNVTSQEKIDDSAVMLLCNQAHGQTQTDLSDSESEPMPIPIIPLKKRQNIIMAKCHIARPKQEAKTTSSHIDSVLAFVASDVFNSTPPMESGLGDELIRLQNKMQNADLGIIQNSENVQNNNNKVFVDIKEGTRDDTCPTITKLETAQLMLKDDEKEGETNKVIRVKKIRKKISDLKKLSPLTEALPIGSDGELTGKKKKKVTQIKSIMTQKNVDIYQPAIPFSSDTAPVSDKEILSTNRAETSDIGESIASTSGGSEQDTPIHEPEGKDEIPASDPCSAEKESQDTGLESDGDDSKPVKKYKKRLDFVKCAHCEHQARGRSALSRHMKKIHMMDVNMPYKCHKCDYGCTKMASLNRHLYTHGVFPCSRCDFVADERIKLGQHVMDQHKDKLDMKLCKVCNRYIKCDQLTIEAHTNVCQGPTPFKCSECEKEFKYASSLRVHYHTHFPDRPKKFKCDQCEYRTNYKANLHKHHKNMHASRDRDVQCPDCGKLFSTEDNMRRHRKVHTLMRPFACEICKKTFKTSGALKGHHLIHTATRPYSCNIPGCNRSFRTPKFLKSHQEEFHRLVPKKFFCTVDGCNYSFFKRSHLKRHAITHTGERNFHCTWPNCSKSFRHADNLKVHFRSHTNEKPVQCHLCDFKCKQKNSLFWHKKKVHHIIDASVCLKRSEAKLKLGELDKNMDEIEDPDASLSNTGQTQEHSDEAEAQTSEDVGAIQKSGTKVSLGGTGECSTNTENEEKISQDLKASEPGANETLAEAQSVDTPEKSAVLDAKPVMKEQSISTQTPISRDCGPRDLYEFNSDNESEEETPGNFRRDKIAKAILTPLPPPPKELLRKNEMLEKKEKEKKEKAEKREMEKKEKAEKREQEKKERSEKKELEKKERIEKKEQEKKDKAEKKLMDKKDKAEKKLMDKKDKAEKKELEKKEKEQEKKEKEQEKQEKEQEKIEKQKEKKEKQKEKKEKQKEKKEKDQEKKETGQEEKETEQVKKETKQQKKETKQVKKEKAEKKMLEKKEGKTKSKRGSLEESDKHKEESPGNKKKLVNPVRRKRSSSLVAREEVNDVTEEPEQTRPTRKKKGKPVDAPKNDDQESSKEEMSPSPAKRKKVLHKKTDLPDESQSKIKTSRVMLRRSSVSNVPAVRKGRKKGRLVPPKRKPSARILAKNKATAKEKAVVKSSKAQKLVPKKRTARKRSSTRVEEEKEEELVKVKSPKEELLVVESKVEEMKVSPHRKSEEVKKIEVKPKEECDEPQTVLNRPLSPAYSEELMLQGKASPYRDFSDADTVEEEEEDGNDGEAETASPAEVISEDMQSADRKTEGEAVVPELNEQEDDEDSKSIPPTVDESSDDEVSNDIPLTPPRAPAPPPMESSEDEMEPEPALAPFSVPGPNTPFSVPGPNTPFSVPPPTNLLQQHSVHSEEAPMSAVPSVPSMEMHSQGSVEMQQSLGSVEMNHPLSVEMNHPHGSVEMHHPHGSVEMHHPHGSVEMHHPHGSVEMHHSHGSVEMHHPHGSVEMHHPHGSAEMHHPHGSAEMHHSHGSVEMHHQHGSAEMHHPHGSVEIHHQHGSVEMHHPHGSVEMHHPHGSVEMRHPHGSVEMHHSHGSVEMHSHSTSSEMHTHSSGEMRSHGSVERHHSHGSVEMVQPLGSIQEPEQHRSVRTPDNGREVKYDLPPLHGQNQTMDADKEYFDQYLKSLSAANNSATNGGVEPPTSGLRELEAMVGKSHQDLRDMGSKSPMSSLPNSVITSLESTLPILGPGDLRARMDVFDRHHESLYVRDTPSSLPRLSDPRSVTPLPPNAAFDAFSSLTSLHPGATAGSGRENSYLRQPDNLFPTPPVTSNFMAEAMFQHQAMSTPFLPPQPSDRSSLSRIPDTTQLRSNSSSLLRRTSAMPGTDMFSSPAIPQAMPRNPFTNAWASQDTRASHWQTPYLQRQPNMTTPSSFFPSKENYLTGREFMFDPSVRQSAERAMFPSLSSSQPQDTFQLDRFDLSNYFPNAMTPYASSTGTLDYTRSAHSAAKPFDERYRQSAAASAGIPDFRGLPPSTGSSDMFSGLPSVNSGFNLYASNPMSYHHPQHMTDNVNSAFLSHSTSAQHAMFERDYAAHRGLYPQNTPYPFIDERQYGAPSKLTHTHSVAPTATSQERDLMSRSVGPESQMQDPYRSVLYRY